MNKAKPNSPRKSEKRIKRIQKNIPISIAEQKKYDKYLKQTKELENEIDRLEDLREKKLEEAKKLLGIDKIEKKIEALQEKIDDISDEKVRFEKIVIDFLAEGGKLIGFKLKSLGKRFSVSYKSICDEIFEKDPTGYEEAKMKYGSRKEDYILIYEGEEVSQYNKSA